MDGRPLFGCFGHINASKRIPQLLEAFAAVRRRIRTRSFSSSVRPRPGTTPSGSRAKESSAIDYVDEERLWSLMAACDVLRLAARADDGRDVGQRHPRALARASRSSSATSAGSPSCPTPSPSRCRSTTTSPRARRGARAARRRASRPSGDGRGARALRASRARPRPRRGALRRALEEAAGGTKSRTRWSPKSPRRQPRSGSWPARTRAELAGRLDEVGLGAKRRRPDPARPSRSRSRSPALGVAHRARRRLRRLPLRPRAPGRRAVDHGRRAHLLGAREELRLDRPLLVRDVHHGGVRRSSTRC